MTDTTIAVDSDVKAKIRELQREYETFNQTLSRLADAHKTEGEKWTEDEIVSLIHEKRNSPKDIERIVDRRIEELRR